MGKSLVTAVRCSICPSLLALLYAALVMLRWRRSSSLATCSNFWRAPRQACARGWLRPRFVDGVLHLVVEFLDWVVDEGCQCLCASCPTSALQSPFWRDWFSTVTFVSFRSSACSRMLKYSRNVASRASDSTTFSSRSFVSSRLAVWRSRAFTRIDGVCVFIGAARSLLKSVFVTQPGHFITTCHYVCSCGCCSDSC